MTATWLVSATTSPSKITSLHPCGQTQWPIIGTTTTKNSSTKMPPCTSRRTKTTTFWIWETTSSPNHRTQPFWCDFVLTTLPCFILKKTSALARSDTHVDAAGTRKSLHNLSFTETYSKRKSGMCWTMYLRQLVTIPHLRGRKTLIAPVVDTMKPYFFSLIRRMHVQIPWRWFLFAATVITSGLDSTSTKYWGVIKVDDCRFWQSRGFRKFHALLCTLYLFFLFSASC